MASFVEGFGPSISVASMGRYSLGILFFLSAMLKKLDLPQTLFCLGERSITAERSVAFFGKHCIFAFNFLYHTCFEARHPLMAYNSATIIAGSAIAAYQLSGLSRPAIHTRVQIQRHTGYAC